MRLHEIYHQKRFSHLHYLIVSAPNNRNGKQNEGFKTKKLCVLFATWQMFWKFMKVHIWRIRGISLYKLMFCLIFHQSIHLKSPTYILSLLNYQTLRILHIWKMIYSIDKHKFITSNKLDTPYTKIQRRDVNDVGANGHRPAVH